MMYNSDIIDDFPSVAWQLTTLVDFVDIEGNDIYEQRGSNEKNRGLFEATGALR